MSTNRGFFDLSGFESKSDDDILNAQIFTEDAEFAPNSNATNCVDNGVKDATVSIPGGDKETPTAKPYDANSVSIPGGDSEKPHASAVPGVKVSIPSKTTLTAQQYNAALDTLQKSFREAAELVQALKECTIVTESVEDRQARFMEDAMNEAALTALEDGPLFEAVKRADKEEVKKICREIRKILDSSEAATKYNYQSQKMVSRDVQSAIEGGVGAIVGGAAGGLIAGSILGLPIKAAEGLGLLYGAAGGAGWTLGTAIGAMVRTLLLHSWQVAGSIYVPRKEVDGAFETLNEQCKDSLPDGYKLIPIVTNKLISDGFRAKFKWKEHGTVVLVVIDKEAPEDLKALGTEVEVDKKALKDLKEKNGGEKKDESKKDEGKKE